MAATAAMAATAGRRRCAAPAGGRGGAPLPRAWRPALPGAAGPAHEPALRRRAATAGRDSTSGGGAGCRSHQTAALAEPPQTSNAAAAAAARSRCCDRARPRVPERTFIWRAVSTSARMRAPSWMSTTSTRSKSATTSRESWHDAHADRWASSASRPASVSAPRRACPSRSPRHSFAPPVAVILVIAPPATFRRARRLVPASAAAPACRAAAGSRRCWPAPTTRPRSRRPCSRG